MLLPLPPEKRKKLQLQYHLALVAVRGGHGNPELVAVLLNAIYVSFDLGGRGHCVDLALYQRADAALHAYMDRMDRDEDLLSDDEAAALERVLTMYDTQLSRMPSHRYVEACERTHQFVLSGGESPIATASGSKADHPIDGQSE
ncbi:hypothetical protein [Burkholderia gladioli]|nr:hypothetical protein [Burkholderia gladioli]MBW5286931.1 hypothetical protein [Burkholderia gladioli]